MSNENVASALNDWFLSAVEYEGRGRAEFQNPLGSVEGPAKVRFDDRGNTQIELHIDPATIQAEPPLKTGMLLELLNGPPAQGPTGKTIGYIGGQQNQCTKLEVYIPEGTFAAVRDISYGQQLNLFSNSGAILQFHMLESHFTSTQANEAAYWVLPLTNFVSSYAKQFQELAAHPLRFTMTNNPVIAFLYKNTPAYIEPLLDYQEREEKLSAGQLQQAVTAIMVGKVGGSYAQYSEIQGWLPLDLLPLLSVATGSEVGAPWIELRGDDGRLVKRIHINFSTGPFSRGHVAIRETVDNGGIGRLLTGALSSAQYGQSVLRVASKYLVRGGKYNSSMEDQVAQLCRGLDGLCKHYHYDEIDLAASLGSIERAQVTEILADAQQQIKAVAAAVQASGNFDVARNIIRIADKVRNASQKDKPFGISVAELVKKQFGLHDPDIVDAYYQANPRSDGRKTWSDVLSFYRGTVIHESYFGFGGLSYNSDDIWAIRNHLHDLLLRMILKMADYDGTYQPTVIRMTTREETDWVQPHLTAKRLGYS